MLVYCVMDGGELEDLQFLGSARTLHPSHVTHFLSQQGASDGGGRGNFPVRGVCLFAGNQIVRDFFVALGIQHNNRRAEPDPIVRDLGEINHGHLRQAFLQLVQACVHEPLAVLGGVILRVFAQIPVGPGFQNLPRQLVAQFVFKSGDFVLKLFFDVVHRRGITLGDIIAETDRSGQQSANDRTAVWTTLPWKPGLPPSYCCYAPQAYALLATTNVISSACGAPKVKLLSDSIAAFKMPVAESARRLLSTSISFSSPYSSPATLVASVTPSLYTTRKSPGPSCVFCSPYDAIERTPSTGPPPSSISTSPDARTRIGGLCPAFANANSPEPGSSTP